MERTNLSLRMSLRTKLALAFGAVLVVALAGHILVPGRFCGLTLLGDEGEGECLALIASRIPAARCRVLAAISDEIRGTNNDVVLAPSGHCGCCEPIEMPVEGSDTRTRRPRGG